MFDKTLRNHCIQIMASMEREVLYKAWDKVDSWEELVALYSSSCQDAKRENAIRAWEDSLVFHGEEEYPTRLYHLPDPPPWLYVRGELPTNRFLLAVVGSRQPTPYGREMARVLADQIIRAGAGIVSGLARGIDSEAHWASLKAEGYTLAVLGSGWEHIYPRENKKLMEAMLQQGGCVMTEYHPWERPLPHHFPHRNRIIAALAKGIVVIEARERSGSLITARIASDLGREVFVLPGPVHYESFRGSHRLIQEGAKLIQGVEDIVAEYPEWEESILTSPSLPVPPHLVPLWEVLTVDQPLHLDQLAQALGKTSAEVNKMLTELELLEAVTRHPGGFFTKKVV